MMPVIEIIVAIIVMASMLSLIIVAFGKQVMKHEQRLKIRRQYDNSRNN